MWGHCMRTEGALELRKFQDRMAGIMGQGDEKARLRVAATISRLIGMAERRVRAPLKIY